MCARLLRNKCFTAFVTGKRTNKIQALALQSIRIQCVSRTQCCTQTLPCTYILLKYMRCSLDLFESMANHCLKSIRCLADLNYLLDYFVLCVFHFIPFCLKVLSLLFASTKLRRNNLQLHSLRNFTPTQGIVVRRFCVKRFRRNNNLFLMLSTN